MVPRVGFEPTTSTLEPSCSNPLSYRGAPIGNIIAHNTLFVANWFTMPNTKEK